MPLMKLKTPYYLIDERKILKNLKKIERLKRLSKSKVVLALKCFSSWGAFPLISQYLDGSTSSSLYEARLGFEKFKKEVHAYSVAFSLAEVKELAKFSDKVIFNSISQLNSFRKYLKGINFGIRVNPELSYSEFDLADPARKFSRLGVTDIKALKDRKSVV